MNLRELAQLMGKNVKEVEECLKRDEVIELNLTER
jgi:hypothetical protein